MLGWEMKNGIGNENEIDHRLWIEKKKLKKSDGETFIYVTENWKVKCNSGS